MPNLDTILTERDIVNKEPGEQGRREALFPRSGNSERSVLQSSDKDTGYSMAKPGIFSGQVDKRLRGEMKPDEHFKLGSTPYALRMPGGNKIDKTGHHELKSYSTSDKLFMKINSNCPKDSMDKERFQRIAAGLKRTGIDVISDKDTDGYLTAMGAEAMTMSDGKAILIRSGSIPTASAFFEEIIHATQIKANGSLNEYSVGVSKEYLRREIEANEKLLRYAKTYGFTENDVLDIQNNLEKYKQEWMKGGFDYE